MNTHEILIVEDEPMVAVDLAETVESLGYRVLAIVESGVQAIRHAERKRPSLVLMDIGLKGEIDGIIAAAYLRDRLNVPVIYLTGQVNEEIARRAEVTNPYGFLIKPVKESQLKLAIEIALEKHSAVDGILPKRALK